MYKIYFYLLIHLSVSLGLDPYKDLFWFIQITDVHISLVEDPSRISDFKHFCNESLDVFKPLAVICSGDLTEAKEIEHIKAHQNEQEWRIYSDAVQNRNPPNVPWLDIRGNHDNFNVLNRQSDQNFFSNYSESGRHNNLRSYRRTISKNGTTFNFVALDATWEIGMNYPFNFVGYFDQKERESLQKMTQNLTKDEVNIFFGHYPTSVVTQNGFIRDLLSKSMVYLCGHLHDLGPFKMRDMYTFHKGKDLELELVDWKYKRAFRVLAVDNGRLSFTDVRYNEWPVILPTWPKAHNFILSGKEPPVDQNPGKLIKILVFSPPHLHVKSVEVSIDGGTNRWMNIVASGPLYTAPWKPENYKNGLHKMVVTVIDEKDNVKTHEQVFTLNPSEAVQFRKRFNSLVLESSFGLMFQILFVLTLFFNLAIAVSLRVLYFSAQREKLSSSCLARLRSAMGCWFFRKLFLVSICDRLFLPLLVYILYMAVGPWVIGHLVEGHVGLIFAWGVVVDGELVPSQVPFAYYWIHFFLVHPILVIIYGHILDVRRFKIESEIYSKKYHRKSRFTFLPKLHWSCALISAILVFALTMYFTLAFWLEFGVLGFFVGPFRTWTLIFYAILAIIAWKMPAGKCVEKIDVIFRSDSLYSKHKSENTLAEESQELNSI